MTVKESATHNLDTRIDILGIQIDPITMSQALDTIQGWIVKPSGKPRYIVKPYVEFLTRASSDKKLLRILNGADLSVADGVSLQWAASFLYGMPSTKPTLIKLIQSAVWRIQQLSWRTQIIPEKFAGVNFTKMLLHRAESQSWRIGVIGGPRSTSDTRDGLMIKFPDLQLIGVWSGFSSTTHDMTYDNKNLDREFANIINEIKAAQLDILFVALGFPRQEVFIAQCAKNTGAKVLIGEGGSFDYDQLGGKLRRAPGNIQRLGLEWLWRLILQPTRFKRQLAVPIFAWKVLQKAKSRWKQFSQGE